MAICVSEWNDGQKQLTRGFQAGINSRVVVNKNVIKCTSANNSYNGLVLTVPDLGLGKLGSCPGASITRGGSTFFSLLKKYGGPPQFHY